MNVSDRKRKALIRANIKGDGDILRGDWVKLITGGPSGYVESITRTNDPADCDRACVRWIGARTVYTDVAIQLYLLKRVRIHD